VAGVDEAGRGPLAGPVVAAAVDIVDQARRVGRELRGRVGLARVEDVDQVVRQRGTLGHARLGGADVHAAVDQRRIDADDFQRHAFGQRQRDRALAAGGRPGQADPRDRAHLACVGAPWR
jgi:hypothetical protein